APVESEVVARRRIGRDRTTGHARHLLRRRRRPGAGCPVLRGTLDDVALLGAGADVLDLRGPRARGLVGGQALQADRLRLDTLALLELEEVRAPRELFGLDAASGVARLDAIERNGLEHPASDLELEHPGGEI